MLKLKKKSIDKLTTSKLIVQNDNMLTNIIKYLSYVIILGMKKLGKTIVNFEERKLKFISKLQQY